MDSGDHVTVEMRLAAIEEKLDRVLAHLDIDEDPGLGGYAPLTTANHLPNSALDTDQEISAMVQAGKKIQAIKAYRQATGVGLKEAKDAIDAMARNMRGSGRR